MPLSSQGVFSTKAGEVSLTQFPTVGQMLTERTPLPLWVNIHTLSGAMPRRDTFSLNRTLRGYLLAESSESRCPTPVVAILDVASRFINPGPPECRRVHFCQRARAAALAIFCRCSGVRRFALAFSPFTLPTRLLEGCRFDSLTVSSASPVAMSNTCLASYAGSRGRLATKRVCHRPHRRSML